MSTTSLRLLSIRLAALSCAAVLACGAFARRAPRSQSLRITASSGDIETPLSLPFADGQNGTQLVLQFLLLAESRGVDRIADIEIRQRVEEEGEAFLCVTRVATHPPAAGAVRYAKGPLRRLTREIMESEFRCVVRNELEYTPAASMSLDATRILATPRCEATRVRHTVTRFAFQLKTGFSPPDWQHVAEMFADQPLHEHPPRCRRIDAGNRSSVHEIVARAHLPEAANVGAPAIDAQSGRSKSTQE